MNKNNARDYLPFVQALAEGKTIQTRNFYEEWIDSSSIAFDAEPNRYRIKPEPKKQWCRVALFKGKDDYFTQSLGNLLHEKVWEAETGFVRWITDRIEYELPEGEV